MGAKLVILQADINSHSSEHLALGRLIVWSNSTTKPATQHA